MSMGFGMALGAIGAGMKDAGMSGEYWAKAQSALETPTFGQNQQNALYSPQQVDSVAKNNQGAGGMSNIVNLLKGLGMWGDQSGAPEGTWYDPTTDTSKAPWVMPNIYQ